MTILESSQHKCKAVIFDLDGTLHDLIDGNVKLGKDVLNILNILKQKNIKIALASLNSSGYEYLVMHGILHFFDTVHVKNWILYGTNKGDLFNNISNKLNIPYESMLFFDDSIDHIIEANDYNIKTVQVTRAKLLTLENLESGLKLFDI